MNIHPRRWRILVLVGWIGALLLACTPTTPPPLATSTPVVPVPPRVEIVEAPAVLCRTATQLRLAVQTDVELTAETPAEWQLLSPDGQPAGQGIWTVRDGVVLVPLPADAPLASGIYTLHLTWREHELATYEVRLRGGVPAITELSVSLTPDGRPRNVLPVGPRVVYVTYQYADACIGTPYWVTVWDVAGEKLCSETGTLTDLQGSGAVACFTDGDGLLPPGAYRVEMTLTDAVRADARFTIEAPVAVASPTPAPTPTPQPVSCEAPFVAAGITSAGEPFLSPELFDWYTEVVYAGARCQNLTPETAWQSQWYLDGVVVRDAAGTWVGAPAGVLWDSLTGELENPFLAPGTYTVTLTVSGVPLTSTFSVFDYESRETAEGAATTPAAPQN